MPPRHWHAAYVRPAHEVSVNDGLRARGIDTLFLFESVETRHARQVNVVRRPLFSRYVVVAADDDEDVHAIKDTPGVLHLLGDSEGPLCIGEKDIRTLRRLGDESGELRKPAAQVRKALMPGTRVRVRGTLEPFLAFVLLDQGGPKMDLRIKIFRRWVKGSFDAQSVEVIQRGRVSPARSDK